MLVVVGWLRANASVGVGEADSQMGERAMPISNRTPRCHPANILFQNTGKMSAPKAQKHHFIPRFILRNFAPADQPPARPAASANRKSRGGDFLVNKIDLESSSLTQRPASTEFALVDMYRDPGFEESPCHLEKKLARLEGEASEIINRAAKKFMPTPHAILSLKRREVDTLRKFLFLMKYRNGGMFERYNHDDVEDYDSDDRPRMLRYMAAKGFKTPRDVWFNNLRHMLDLEMDPQRK